MNYDVLKEEYLERHQIEQLQVLKWNKMLENILPQNMFYAKKLSFLNSSKIKSLNELDKIPFTTKHELLESQAKYPPYGQINTYELSKYIRMHQTSGSTGTPLKILDTKEDWQWFIKCWGIIYRAVGIDANDVLFFAFSFGPFIGFWAAFEGALSLGNRCLTGGGMTSIARLQSIIDNHATCVCCTPTYALRLAEIAKKNDIDLKKTKVTKIIVAGEPGGSVPEIREQIENAWGARVFDHSGMTEVGAMGIECAESPGHTHFIESEYIIEVIDSNTLKKLPIGEEGELVVTNLGRYGSPLIRYRTGDIVRLTTETCKCQRNYCRAIGGIKGRRDDMIFVRGNNVYPSALEGVIRRFSEISEFQIIIQNVHQMADIEIKVEALSNPEKICSQLQQVIHNEFHFRTQVTPVELGSLPRFEMKAKRWIKK